MSTRTRSRTGPASRSAVRWAARAGALVLLVLTARVDDVAAQDAPCEGDPKYGVLDFWVGDWTVTDQQGNEVGTNRIEKALSACAVVEHWRGRGGGAGMSLFYYDTARSQWKQVWVTARGSFKEKRLIATFDDGGVRFQGELLQADGRVILDRTTLTPMSEGRVRQVIETSRDGGRSWQVGFDAIYVPMDPR